MEGWGKMYNSRQRIKKQISASKRSSIKRTAAKKAKAGQQGKGPISREEDGYIINARQTSRRSSKKQKKKVLPQSYFVITPPEREEDFEEQTLASTSHNSESWGRHKGEEERNEEQNRETYVEGRKLS